MNSVHKFPHITDEPYILAVDLKVGMQIVLANEDSAAVIAFDRYPVNSHMRPVISFNWMSSNDAGFCLCRKTKKFRLAKDM